MQPNYFPPHQIAVTYTHTGTWSGPIPAYAGAQLPNTLAKLSQGKPITVILYGDSISAGACASSIASPYLPIWGQLVVNTWQKIYHSTITFHDTAVGGTASTWGLTNVYANVSQYNPDLVIIGFGMNECSASTLKSNLTAMMNNVKTVNPNAEFILVSTTIPNPIDPNFNCGQAQDESAIPKSHRDRGCDGGHDQSPPRIIKHENIY